MSRPDDGARLPGPAVVARARWVATAAFFTNGALLGALIPHYPQAKAVFGLDPVQFGFTVVALMLGGACAGSLPAPILRRFGSRTVTLLGTAVLAVLMVVAGAALDLGAAAGPAAALPFLWVFLAATFLAGVGDAVVDTSQNAQGLRVKTALGRPVLTSMHAGWSLGAALGAAGGAIAVGLGASSALHLAVNGAACLAVLVVIRGHFLPAAPTHDDGVPASTHGAPANTPAETPTGMDPAHAPAPPTDLPSPAALPPRRTAVTALLPVVLVALAGFAVEEFGNGWTALFLQTERGLAPSAAALGASTLLLAQFVGRLTGDRMIDALGRHGALRAGLSAVVVGLVLTLMLGLPVGVAYAGLALAGLGCAVAVPVAYALGDEVPGLPEQTGLAVVSWLMRVAGLALSPAVGLLAARLGLPVALWLFPALALVGMALTWALPRPRTGSTARNMQKTWPT